MAGVSCFVAQRDWNGLVAFLRGEGRDQMEFLRLAFVSRGQRELGRKADADREWNRAVTLAAKNPEALRLLVRTVSSWDWPDQTRDLLWMLARGNSSPKNALYALYRYYQAAGDTQGLFRVLQRLVEVDAADDVVRNNLAAISLLLQVNVPASIKVAAELHQRHPNNSAFASTHAVALLRSGQAFKARKVMETLGEPALKNPPVAAYYGVILAESGAAVIEIGNVYTGGTPGQPGPWATATFTQNGSSVDLTLKAQNLSSTEFITKWLFNLDSSLNPSSLTFSQIAKTGLFDAPSITATAPDAQIAGAGFRFDLVFGFATSGSAGGTKRFTDGDEITYTISRAGGLSVDDFLTTADKNGVSLTSALHIQGIANNLSGESSAWAGDGVPVPEPATVIAGCLLVGILAYRERSRWQPALARLKA
jgi:hypothetical protein